MKFNSGIILAIIFVGTIFAGMIYLFWSLSSDNGRLSRDLGTDLSDDTVKGYWCGFLGFPEGYSKIDGKEYCGDVQVNVKCIFTNKGDSCSIKEAGK